MLLKRIVFLAVSFAIITVFGIDKLQVQDVASNGHGMKCKYQGNKTVVFLDGTPEQMGAAHGQLLKKDIAGMHQKILLVAAGYMYGKDDWFFSRIAEVMQRTKPYMPERFYDECDAMAKASGISSRDGRHLNFFPEMFHCSGAAVRGKATTDGKLIHARVLDYMFDIRIQDHAAVMVFMPENHNNWISVSYAGFIGTVTAMNEKGLAMGEMGGRGEGLWDGLPMSFMMRRVMEECATVDEAVKLMQSVPLTCEYYYVISDKDRNMVGVYAQSGQPMQLLKPGQQDKRLPEVPEDTVFMSGGERAKHLGDKLKDNFGKIDVAKMIEIIKRPVAMKSNLHNVVFVPETGDFYFSDAGRKILACNMPYYKLNVKELLDYYRDYKNNHSNAVQK